MTTERQALRALYDAIQAQSDDAWAEGWVAALHPNSKPLREHHRAIIKAAAMDTKKRIREYRRVLLAAKR